MDVGIYLDGRNPAQWARPWPEHYARMLELVERAEQLGAASVWLSEHHFFEDGYLPQPLTFAAAIAARTTTIRIGTAVLLAALRHPAQLAEEAAVVDILSAGRLDLGIGLGYRVPEYEGFGREFAGRFAQTEACIREVVRLWETGGITPRPVQQPMPLWGGFFGPRGARLAGELGAGLLAFDRNLLEPYRAGLAAGGHDPASARVGAVCDLVLADDPEAAWAVIRPHLSYMWDSYNRYAVEGTGNPTPRPIDPDRWRAPGKDGRPPRFGVFTPEDAAAHIRALTDGLPAVQVYLWASIAGMPDDLVDRHVELASTELRDRLL
jgi:alkanesulfonate monooxygenase SsuD/methylene tetrahydromethanopterin reductase-like flavin-dependent oxidoreductase (luciferase family)